MYWVKFGPNTSLPWFFTLEIFGMDFGVEIWVLEVVAFWDVFHKNFSKFCLILKFKCP